MIIWSIALKGRNPIMEYSTNDIIEAMNNCDNVEDLKADILNRIKNQREDWIEKVNSIIKRNGYTQSELAKLCGVSRVAVAKWCKGTLPQNRDTFIKIGFAAHYSQRKRYAVS